MLSLEDLAELGDTLRGAGFRIAPQQYFDAQQVLLGLAAAGALPEEPAGLESFLAPVFCKSAIEQQRFAHLYSAWCNKLKPPPAPPGGSDRAGARRKRRVLGWLLVITGAAVLLIAAQVFLWQHYRLRTIDGIVTRLAGEAASDVEVTFGNLHTRTDANGRFSFPRGVLAADLPGTIEARSGNLRGLAFAGEQFQAGSYEATAWVSAAVSSALAAWLARLYAYSTDWSDAIDATIVLAKPAQSDRDEPSMAPMPLDRPRRGPEEMQTLPRQRVDTGSVLAILFPLLVLAGWASIRLSRRPVLRRLASRTPAEVRELYLAGGIRALLPGWPLRRLAQELRRRRFVPSEEIQPEPTVLATLRRAGLFTAVRGSRVEPEYLALVDRASLADHFGLLADQILAELARSDVLVSRYDFDRSAEYCRPRVPFEPAAARELRGAHVRRAPVQGTALESLRERHPEHRVLVFSDGGGCFDSFTGAPAPWLETLLGWSSPIVITPMPPERWGRREWALEQLGLTVLPLSQQGMLALMGLLGGTPSVERGQRRFSYGTEPLHDSFPSRWLERRSPGASTLARLCAGLQSELGARGFAWLASCAAYPEIHWGITLRLARELVPDRTELERLVPRLARLIWFREAFMPDWLRQALLERLPVEDEVVARKVISAMLESVAIKGSGDHPIRIALGEPVVPRLGLLRHVRDWWHRRRAANRARQMIEAAPPESPLRDIVFLQFINGERRIDRLSLLAPLALLRTLALRQQRMFPQGFKALVVSIFLSVLAAWTWPPVHEIPSLALLPDLGADPANVTVSGFSSGGTMAVQFHVAHSASVRGAGVIAGMPYYCARGSLFDTWANCEKVSASAPLLSPLKDEVDAQAKAGRIDAAANLARGRVWLFHGTQDALVPLAVSRAVGEFYRLFGSAIVAVGDVPAGHGFPTEGEGNPCSVSLTPFINDCAYDAAGQLLAYLLGPLKPPATKQSGRLIRFDQNLFAGDNAHAIGLDDAGYAYIPQVCETQQCRLHVAFHGCRQNAQSVGERFVRDAGYNRWADTNNLIVVYPQTVARNGLGGGGFIYNPGACWDWWGYTGSTYHTKEGAQVRAIKAMLDRLGGSVLVTPVPLPEDAAVEVIRIGHVAPLTGGIAHLGKDNESGARLAIEEANAAKIRIGGRVARFELVAEDDEADPRVATVVAQRLVDARVAGVVGHLNSGSSIPASPTYAKAAIPAISPSATNPRLTELGFPTAFRIIGRDDGQGPALARYIVASRRPELAAVIDDGTAYGEGLANEFERTLRAFRIRVLPRERGTDRTTDWRGVLNKLRGPNPDVILYGGMDRQGGPLLRQARELGMTGQFLFGDGGCTDQMSTVAGSAAEGLLCVQAGLPPDLVSGRFLDAFRKRFNTDPILYAPFAYDAAKVLIEAMGIANSSAGREYLPVLRTISHEGVTGRIEFDAKGDRREPDFTIFTMRQDRIEPIAVVRGQRVLTRADFGQLQSSERR